MCRWHGISQQTFHPWKAKHGMGLSEAQKLKTLEEENRRLSQLASLGSAEYRASES